MFDESVFAFANKPFTRFQMERVGYYVVDPDSTMEKPIFNRTLGLRERADKKKVGAKNSGAADSGAGAAAAGAGPSAWTKTEIKVGQIVKAWEHPDSEKVRDLLELSRICLSSCLRIVCVPSPIYPIKTLTSFGAKRLT